MSLIRGTQCELNCEYEKQSSALYVSFEDVKRRNMHLVVAKGTMYIDYDTLVDRMLSMFSMCTGYGITNEYNEI